VDLRDLSKIGAIQVELNQRILDVQSALLEMQEKLAAKAQAFDELKTHARELEEAARDRERYVLFPIMPGAFVYRLRDGVEPSEPVHYVCQTCFDKGVKSVLTLERHSYGATYQTCPACRRGWPRYVPKAPPTVVLDDVERYLVRLFLRRYVRYCVRRRRFAVADGAAALFRRIAAR
jgi:hypothetical protein